MSTKQIEALKLALEALELYQNKMSVQMFDDAVKTIREALAEQPAQQDEYGYAKRLAEWLWQKHYAKDAPDWVPFDNLAGVLTQIDNMVCRLVKEQPAQTMFLQSRGAGYGPAPSQRLEIGKTEQLAQEDPCPGCRKGGVCRTPKCGRLKLPVDHPLRSEQPALDEDQTHYKKVIDDVQALFEAKREQQEPVAYSYTSRITGAKGFSHHPMPRFIDADSWNIKPLYTHPQSKPWVGLTDEEREHIWNIVGNSDAHGDVDGLSGRYVMDAIEAKLKEKNA